MSITEVAIKRPLLITVIFVTLILFGFISYNSLNYNLLPKFEANIIAVVTTYPGASADEIQTTVTKPIEDAVSSIEGVDKISSTSQEGVSIVTVQLKTGTKTTLAQQDAERKINQMKSTLPDDIDDPVVNRFNSDELPVLRIGTSANMNEKELYDLVDQQIKPILANVGGVGSVTMIGGTKREIQVNLDPDKLQAYNISAAQVNMAIANSNSSYPAGDVQSRDSRYGIRLDARLGNTDDIRNLVIKQDVNGSRVLLSDVATVTDAVEEVKTLNRINGKSGIGIEIKKQSDANAVDVSSQVKKKLKQLEERYASKGLKFDIAVDQAIYTLSSADAVMHDLVLAVFIVASVMLLFMHSIRSSLFVLVALPSAMIPTFILMYAFGFSLNLMTLMALSLVVGILVDDSIVVLENIFRHMEMGKNKRTASLDGRNEIGFTAMAITLVDVVVFVPMALAGGMIGNILREFSLVVVFSTLMSLMVSFTLTPLLSSRWGKLEHLTKKTWWGRFSLWFEKMIDNLKEAYGKILSWSLDHKRYILIGVFLLFVASFALVPMGFIGTAFVSPSDRGELNISLEMAPETPIYQMNQKVFDAEKIVLKHPEVTKVFTSVGTQSGNALTGNTSNSNLAELSVVLVDKKDRDFSTDDFGVMIRDELSVIPGLKVTIKPVSITGNSEAPIQIAIKGVNMDDIWETAKMVKDVVRNTPGTDYVEYSTKTPKPEVDIHLDKEKLAAFGLTVPEVSAAIQIYFRGNDNSKFRESGEEYNINVISDESGKQDIENVRNMTVMNSRGAKIRLDEIATITEITGQAVLERSDRMNSIKVTAFTIGRPTGSVIADIQKELSARQLPDGVVLDYVGEAERQKDAFGSLGIAMLIGFLLVYLIMVALYESIVYPFVVLFSIPVALIGAILALALAMETMSIFAIVGFIMLMGLVAKNGILIVDFTNHLKSQGMALKEALVEAGKERLRPILMTTIAMVAGMLPIALAQGSGAEVKNGMAWVIIGGLSSSLLLTLILVPTMYYIIEKFQLWVKRLFSKKKKTDDITTVTES